MNNIVNKFLLAGDKFMPELHLKDPKVGTYSACGPFTKTKERVERFKETGDVTNIYKNQLDQACFQHDLAYGNKDLATRTSADKVLRDKAFQIAQDESKDGYQRSLASMVYKFFDKKVSGAGNNKNTNNTNNSNNTNNTNNTDNTNTQLADELHRRIIRKFPKRKVIPGSFDNIWGADLADMQLISKYNKGFRFLLCVIDLYSKYAWVVPVKDKKGVTITSAFKTILKQSGRKPNKIWVDKGSEFYNQSMKKFLNDNNIEMYSTENEGKSVVAERFIRTLKTKIYKYMTATSKNTYIDNLQNIVDKYNNSYHRTIKMKPVDVTKDIDIDYGGKSFNDRKAKFKVGDHVRISKYKNIFKKGYMPNWTEEVFVVKEVKNTVPWTYIIQDLNGDEVKGTFYEQELQKTEQNVFRVEKVVKRKGDKLLVKWKGYSDKFNSWIDKNDIDYVI